MANIVNDPKVHPEVITPDLSVENPPVTFKKEHIPYVYGSKWKQRYFQKVGVDSFPLPAQWDVTNNIWNPCNVATGNDWSTDYYPAENSKRLTGTLCDGCQAVHYNIQTKAVTEWNVVLRPSRSSIVNPARLDPIGASDVCIQCHSRGQPRSGLIQKMYYDWPVGFYVGANLKAFWKLERPKLGETKMLNCTHVIAMRIQGLAGCFAEEFTHFEDGAAHNNRMQGNDFVTNVMYKRGISCSSCHDAHGTPNNAHLLKPARAMCLECHGPKSPNGPNTATIQAHTNRKYLSHGQDDKMGDENLKSWSQFRLGELPTMTKQEVFRRHDGPFKEFHA